MSQLKARRPAGLIGVMRRIRIEKSLSQEELEHRIGLAKNQLSTWECGKVQPSGGNLQAWANSLGYELVLAELGTLKRSSTSPEMRYMTGELIERVKNSRLPYDIIGRNNRNKVEEWFVDDPDHLPAGVFVAGPFASRADAEDALDTMNARAAIEAMRDIIHHQGDDYAFR